MRRGVVVMEKLIEFFMIPFALSETISVGRQKQQIGLLRLHNR